MTISKTKMSDSGELTVRDASTGEIKQHIKNYTESKAKLSQVLRLALDKLEESVVVGSSKEDSSNET